VSDLTPAQKAFTMVGALLGMLLAALDQTIVSTAGPAIQRDLHIAPALYVWITTSYLVASTVLVPIYGKLSDVYGRKRLLLVAIGVFLVGSLLCGLARTPAQLIAFRALQGSGAAGLFTSAFAVVADLFPPAERGKWQGLFGGVWGISSVVGPLLGGFLTDNVGWNWAFFVNLPVGVVAVTLIVARMPALRREQIAPAALDLAGAAALTLATVPLLLALSLGHAEGTGDTGWPWLSWQILGLFGLALAATVAFVAIERRAASPILDLGLFRIRAFALGSLATFVVGASFLGAIVFLPLFMVNVVGVSATSAGLTTTPLTFGIVAANITSGQLVSRLGAYKGLLIGSLIVLIGSFAMLALTLAPDATQGSTSAKMVVLGIGLGPSIPLFTLAIQTAVPPPQIGVATAAATFFRQLGSTIGLALLGTVFATTFAGTLATRMPDAVHELSPAARAIVLAKPANAEDTQVAFDAARVTREVDAHVPAGERPGAHAAVARVASTFRDAFTGGIVRVYWISLVIALAGLAITVFLPQLPLRGKP
jgi:EmrB/QacA subfamily drug resistance transporter